MFFALLILCWQNINLQKVYFTYTELFLVDKQKFS